MTVTKQGIFIATVVFAMAIPGREGAGQTSPSATPQPSPQLQSLQLSSGSSEAKSTSPENPGPSLFLPDAHLLFDFKDSDIKLHLQSLMNILRDRSHEGWMMAAYPDPKTSRPLIGAGFSLDVMATEHPQSDPLNPHFFVEPSSAQLWQAAGLDSERLQRILDQFDHDLKTWGKRNYRKKIRMHTLPSELTEEEATSLLRISAIQAVHNAMAYCRDFDQLTASQQMALSQLVFQMGVNLEEFVEFRSAINDDERASDFSQPGEGNETEVEHWNTVERTLMESQWGKALSRSCRNRDRHVRPGLYPRSSRSGTASGSHTPSSREASP